MFEKLCYKERLKKGKGIESDWEGWEPPLRR